MRFKMVERKCLSTPRETQDSPCVPIRRATTVNITNTSDKRTAISLPDGRRCTKLFETPILVVENRGVVGDAETIVVQHF